MRAKYIYENIEFERGIEPRDAMGIGDEGIKYTKKLDKIAKEMYFRKDDYFHKADSTSIARWVGWRSESVLLSKDVKGYSIYAVNAYSGATSKPINDSRYFPRWLNIEDWKDFFDRDSHNNYDDHTNRRKELLKESIEFERTTEPRKAMGIGKIRNYDDLRIMMENNMSDEEYEFFWNNVATKNLYLSKKEYEHIHKRVIDFLRKNKKLINVINAYMPINGSLESFVHSILSIIYVSGVGGVPFLKSIKHICPSPTSISRVKESIEFERGIEPYKAMNIGLRDAALKWLDDHRTGSYNLDDDLNLRFYSAISFFGDKDVSFPIVKSITINGSLDLGNTGIDKLPDNLKVDSWVDLLGTNLTELPNNFEVGMNLFLGDIELTSLPKNLKLHGNTYTSNENTRRLLSKVTKNVRKVNESIEFERGLEPHHAMNIGIKEKLKALSLKNTYGPIDMGNESANRISCIFNLNYEDIYFLGTNSKDSNVNLSQNNLKEIYNILKNEEFKEIKIDKSSTEYYFYKTSIGKILQEKIYFGNGLWYWGDFNAAIKLNIFEKKLIKENIEFERGLEPSRAMSIGIESKLSKWLKDNYGISPTNNEVALHYAVLGERLDFIKYLIEDRGAEITTKIMNLAFHNKIDDDIILYLITSGIIGGDEIARNYIKSKKR